MSAQRWSSCPACRALVDPGERVCPYCQTVLAGRPAPQAARTSSVHLWSAFPMTAIFLALIAALYLLQLLVQQVVFGDPISLGHGITTLLQPSTRIQILFGRSLGPHSPWWIFITTNFLHAGIVHLVFNAMATLSLGPPCERIFGRGRYLLLIFTSGFGGMAIAHWLQPAPHLGFSGILCGMLGALLVFMKHAGEREIQQTLMRWTLFIALFSLMPGVSWAGHLGGFAIGAALTWVMLQRPLRALLSRRAARILGAIAITGLLAGYAGLARTILEVLPYRGSSLQQFTELDGVIVDLANTANPGRDQHLPSRKWCREARRRLRALEPLPKPWQAITRDLLATVADLEAAASQPPDRRPADSPPNSALYAAFFAAAQRWFDLRETVPLIYLEAISATRGGAGKS